MNRPIALTAFVLAAAVSGLARADVSDAEQEFLRSAARGDMMEIKMGELAEKKASNDAIKAFGRQMVQDHKALSEKLKKLAKDKDVGLPDELGEEHRAKIDDLDKLDGSQFDKTYIRHMILDHQDDLAEFRHMSEDAKDTKIRAFATQTIPVLEGHLTLAKDDARKVGVNPDTVSHDKHKKK